MGPKLPGQRKNGLVVRAFHSHQQQFGLAADADQVQGILQIRLRNQSEPSVVVDAAGEHFANKRAIVDQ